MTIESGDHKTTISSVFKQVESALRSQQRKITSLTSETEALHEEIIALRKHNAVLSSGLFMLMFWTNETIAARTAELDGEQAAALQAWLARFSDLQGKIAPETFRNVYGVDPLTGVTVGSGLLTDGAVEQSAFEVHLEDVPAGEMGRIYRDNGALDNNM